MIPAVSERTRALMRPICMPMLEWLGSDGLPAILEAGAILAELGHADLAGGYPEGEDPALFHVMIEEVVATQNALCWFAAACHRRDADKADMFLGIFMGLLVGLEDRGRPAWVLVVQRSESSPQLARLEELLGQVLETCRRLVGDRFRELAGVQAWQSRVEGVA